MRLIGCSAMHDNTFCKWSVVLQVNVHKVH
jgi:hypothetical protein